MAITWDWKTKCGEIKFEQKKPNTDEWEKHKWELYSGGNCWLVMLAKYKDETNEWAYMLQGFFDEGTHMNRCLGLNKGYNNNYKDTPYIRFKSIKLIADKNSHTDKIAKAFKKARPDMKVIVEY